MSTGTHRQKRIYIIPSYAGVRFEVTGRSYIPGKNAEGVWTRREMVHLVAVTPRGILSTSAWADELQEVFCD